MFGRRRVKSPSHLTAERLHGWAVAQARSIDLYAALGAPDTVEGRFELLTLHIILLLDRLQGVEAGDLRQRLFDVFLSHLDGAMREMGVGDLVMGKRMRALGEVFYGRAQAYEGALAALPDRDALTGLVGRTLFNDAAADAAPDLADYVVRCRATLAAAAVAELCEATPQVRGDPVAGAVR